MKHPSDKSESLLTIKDVAERLCCSLANVYALVDRGAAAPIVRIGRSKGYRVTESDLTEFIRERKTQNQVTKPKVQRPPLKHIRL